MLKTRRNVSHIFFSFTFESRPKLQRKLKRGPNFLFGSVDSWATFETYFLILISRVTKSQISNLKKTIWLWGISQWRIIYWEEYILWKDGKLWFKKVSEYFKIEIVLAVHILLWRCYPGPKGGYWMHTWLVSFTYRKMLRTHSQV